MAVLSGILGAVTGVTELRKWDANVSTEFAEYVSSATDGATGAIEGNQDWSGSYDVYGGTPANMPGDSITFTGSIDGTNGVTGAAIVDSVTINWDIEGGGIINHVTAFSGDSIPTVGASVATDAAVANPISAIGTKFQIGDIPADVDDVRSMTLVITAANPSYVSSSTSGGTKRLAGNLSASISISVYTDDWSTLPQNGDIEKVRLFTTGALFWAIDWIAFKDLSSLVVDREAAAIIGATINGIWTGYLAGVKGQIADPTPTVFWP